MKKIMNIIGKATVATGILMAKSDLNVNSPWFHNQPLEPEVLNKKRAERNEKKRRMRTV